MWYRVAEAGPTPIHIPIGGYCSMLRTLLAASSLAVAAPVVLASPAQAETPTCASKSEFRAVQKGWSITRVAHRFDIDGKQISYSSGDSSIDWPAYQSRTYKQIGRAHV